MVVAQLVERSLPIPEVRGSNPVIGKIYIEHLFTVNSFEKTKIKKKSPGIAHFKIHLNLSAPLLVAQTYIAKSMF